MHRAVLLVATLALTGCGDADQPAAPAGPLSVEQALERAPSGPVDIRGYLLVDPGDRVRLCAALAESYPPQCGVAWLVVEGLPPHELPPLERAQGVGWTERPVTLGGTVEGETLRVG